MSTADKLTTIAENQQKVYDAGKQKRYDEFWDEILYEGREDFSYAFAGFGWSDENFNPPKTIKIKGTAYMMFAKNKITDLRKYDIDFSQATDFQYLLWTNSCIKYIGHIDVSGAKRLNGIFHNAHVLERVESITGTDNILFTNADFYTDKLNHIIFTDCIINHTITFERCPLDVESMKSIIIALNNYAGTDKANAYTVTFTSSCWAALEADEEKPPTGGTWKEYVNDLGWNT